VVLNPVRAKAVNHPREWVWSSYRATGALAAVPRSLIVEETLSHLGQRRGPVQEKYREYVREGIGSATIWENLEAQSLLGLEGFADALRGHVTGKETVGEIPKEQRLIGRASLKKLFEEAGKGKGVRVQPDGSGPPSEVALLDDQPIDEERQPRAKVKT